MTAQQPETALSRKEIGLKSSYMEFDPARGSRIAHAMAERGMRYNCQLCYNIGVSESTLSRWRAGRPLSLSHAVALSYSLGVSLDYLLIGEAPRESNCFASDINRFSEIYAGLDSASKRLSLSLLRSLVLRLERASQDVTGTASVPR